MEIQNKLQEQGMPKLGENPMLNRDAWSQFVKMQGPAIQGLMGNYLEQSASAFLEMQQQMQKQARSIFGTFPFSGFTAPADQPASGEAPQSEDKQPQKKTGS